MVRRLAGLWFLASTLVAVQALAQVPTPRPTATSSGAFPAAEQPSPTPPAAAAPAAAPAPAVQAAPGAGANLPTPTPAATPAATTPVTAAPAAAAIAEPPPPPPVNRDLRPNRVRRPFFIGGELGWNGLAGLGANFSYHPIAYFAMDAGLGLAVTGLRLGIRARANLLTGEWTPFLGAGLTYSGGSGGQSFELQSKGETARLELLDSGYVQLAGGVNYTGSEGFVFMATTGYAIRLRNNTRFVSGSRAAYDDLKGLYKGGLIISIAFGYAF